ncbi:MAG: hypothetical protein IT446_09895 [Phycisphaerales bacterium]|nr:hypothetical protein [Phycisphaerales bacterium]
MTQRLNAKIKAGPLVAAPLDHNVYADWSARLFAAGRAQYILLSHTSSLYSVVMYGCGITHDGLFIGRAADAIREFMDYDGLSLFYVNFIAPATAAVRFCKPLDRSVIGSMNELEAVAKLHLATGEISPFDVGFKLNKTLLSAIRSSATQGYSTPRDAFTRLGS